MPPRGKPHAAAWPSISPMWWCSITYAVPALRGPAQVPITPETLQHAAHRVGLEPVLDQVGDARGEQPGQVERGPHVDLAQRAAAAPAWPSRSPGRLEPSFGGISSQQRADQPAEPAEPRLPPLVRVGVALENLRDLLVPAPRVVGQAQVAAVAAGREVRALRVDVVAVLGQPQVAHHVRGQQAHHVRQRGDREVGAERVLRDRRAADGVPPLQHQHPAAGPGQVAGGDQTVVPAADDDRVVRLVPAHRRAIIARRGSRVAGMRTDSRAAPMASSGSATQRRTSCRRRARSCHVDRAERAGQPSARGRGGHAVAWPLVAASMPATRPARARPPPQPRAVRPARDRGAPASRPSTASRVDARTRSRGRAGRRRVPTGLARRSRCCRRVAPATSAGDPVGGPRHAPARPGARREPGDRQHGAADQVVSL